MLGFKEFAMPVLLAIAGVGVLAVLAATPERNATRVALVFAPWTAQADVLRALAGHDLRILRRGWNDSVVIVDIAADPGQRKALSRKALFLAPADFTAACLGVGTPKAPAFSGDRT